MNAHALPTAGTGISTSNIAKLLGAWALVLALVGCGGRSDLGAAVNAGGSQCAAGGFQWDGGAGGVSGNPVQAAITLSPSSMQAGSPKPVTITIGGQYVDEEGSHDFQFFASDLVLLNGSANGVTATYVPATYDGSNLKTAAYFSMTLSAGVLGSTKWPAAVTVQESCGNGPNATSLTQPASLSVTLGILTPSLPNGVVGVAYNQSLTAAGGTTPYTWKITGGTLPAGLALSANGVISGGPTTAGTSTFTVQATDKSNPNQIDQKSLSIVITGANGALSITTPSLPNGTVGTAYNQPVTAHGGTPAYQWTWKPDPGSSLPPGLNIDSNTGAIHGTPTSAGTFDFTVFVIDHSVPMKNASQSFSLTISANQQIGYSPGPVLPGSGPGSGLLVAIDQGVNAGDGDHGVAAVAVKGLPIAAGVPFGSVFLRGVTGAWAPAGKPITATASLAAPPMITGFVLSIAISADGNTIAAGFCEGSPCGTNKIYVYVVQNNNWSGTLVPTSELTAASRGQAAGAALGFSVAVDKGGDVIAAGAPSAITLNGNGYVSVFKRGGASWKASQTDDVQLTAAAPDVGVSVAIDGTGETIVTGAEGFGHVVNAGEAYIFAMPPTGWAVASGVINTPTATLDHTDKPLNTVDILGDYFGRSVAISSDGHTVAVGAPFYKNCSLPCSQPGNGAVFVYLNNGAPGTWASANPIPETAVLIASTGKTGDQLGFSTSISQDGSTIIAGAPSAPNGSCCTPGPGAIYVFQAPAGTWSGSRHETQTFVATPVAGAKPVQFGTSVSVAGDGTIIGAGGQAVVNGAASQFVDLFQ
jgi:hypothetical protein